MRICYYVSDHGWGHATRTIAIVRELLRNRCDIEVFIKASFTAGLLREALRDRRVKVVSCANDFGFASLEGRLGVDGDVTWNQLRKWLRTWDSYVDRERMFCQCHGIDLIVSDIPPQLLIVAHSLGIPGLAVSNFTWHGLYNTLFGAGEEVSMIKRAYELASRSLILPFSEPELPFKRTTPVGIVARRIAVSRDSIRKKLRVPAGTHLVYLGLGRSIDSSIHSFGQRVEEYCRAFRDSQTCLLSSSDGYPDGDLLRSIPSREIETQNYIANCDLVITKAGYSTISEAVRGRVPMLLMAREGVPEDAGTIEEAISLGIARQVTEEQVISGRWRSEMTDLLGGGKTHRAYSDLPERYTRNGCKEVVSIMLGGNEKGSPGAWERGAEQRMEDVVDKRSS